MAQLTSLQLAGWKSIRDTPIPLKFGPITVFIGANGCGKSNLVSFFKLLNEMIGGRLQTFVGRSGGASSVLHYGPKVTPLVEGQVEFDTDSGNSKYFLRLMYAAGDTLIFSEERLEFHRPGFPKPQSIVLGAGHRETLLEAEAGRGNATAKVLRSLIARCRVYQFHDTSESARIRQSCYIEDNRFLMHDAGNLGALLHSLKQRHTTVYGRIVQTIRQVVPFFDDFDLTPRAENPQQILLTWREQGSDLLFGPHQLSDGSLRAMALIALLLQPEDNLPDVIVIDEPELGLHPYALEVLAGLLKKASHHCQVILATQSAVLLDHFDADQVVVVERREKSSTFRRLEAEKLREWLDEYQLSELWRKNVFGGGPH